MSMPAPQLNDTDIEQLSAYLDRQLSDAQRATLEARLQREPALRQVLEELRATVEVLRNLEPVRPPRSFTLDPARVARPKAWWNRLMLPFGGVAGALMVLLLVASVFRIAGSGSGAPVQQAAAAPTAEPAIAARVPEQPAAPLEALTITTATIEPTSVPAVAAEDAATMSSAAAPAAPPAPAGTPAPAATSAPEPTPAPGAAASADGAAPTVAAAAEPTGAATEKTQDAPIAAAPTATAVDPVAAEAIPIATPAISSPGTTTLDAPSSSQPTASATNLPVIALIGGVVAVVGAALFWWRRRR